MATRRKFLHFSSVALAGAAAPRLFAQRAGTPVFSNAALGAYVQGTLSRQRFESLVGTPFRLYSEGGDVVSLTLLSVSSPLVAKTTAAGKSESANASPDHTSVEGGTPARAATSAAKTAISSGKRPTPEQCFLVRFSSGAKVVPQDSYTLDHATLGSFSVFLIPGKGENGGNTCTATFFYLG